MYFSTVLSALLVIQIALLPYLKGDIGYVTLPGRDSIAVIDTTTQTLLTTFPAGDSPEGIALTPNQRYLYVTNYNAGTVTVYDTVFNNALVATITVGTTPNDIAISPDGTLAYAVNIGSSTVSVIDTATNSVTATIPIGVSLNPNAVVFHPNGLYAYVQAQNTPGALYVIDVATNIATASAVNFGTDQPQSLGILPDGSKLYVGLSSGPTNNLGVVSLATPATPTLSTTLSTLGAAVQGIGISPDGLRAYGSNFVDNNAWVLDTATDTFATVLPVPVGSAPWGAAVTLDNAFGAIADSNGGTVSLIDATSLLVVATIDVGENSDPLKLVFKKFISPIPEGTLKGKHKKEDFGVVFQFFNALRWTPSTTAGVAGYHIYRDGVLVGTVGADTFKFNDNNRPKGVAFTYAVTAFDSNGVESSPSFVVVPG